MHEFRFPNPAEVHAVLVISALAVVHLDPEDETVARVLRLALLAMHLGQQVVGVRRPLLHQRLDLIVA